MTRSTLAPSTPGQRAAAARIGARSRWSPGASLTEERRDLRAEQLEAHIRQVVDAAPPLTAEQRERLAGLLNPGAMADNRSTKHSPTGGHAARAAS